MMNWVVKSFLPVVASFLIAVAFGENSEEQTPIQDRPRLYRGPYKELFLDQAYYGPPGYRYSSYYYPFYSPLMYMGPRVPGRSSISFAVGSDGYVGTSFSTSEHIKGTDLVFSLSASWERGEWFYSNLDYELSTISPGISWSNGTTSLFLGLEFSESSFVDSGRRSVRPRVDSGPFKSSVHMNRVMNPVFEYDSINLGLSHQFGENLGLYFNVSDGLFDDPMSLGMYHRLWETNTQSSR